MSRNGHCWGDWLAHEAGEGRDPISDYFPCAELPAADDANTLEGGDDNKTTGRDAGRNQSSPSDSAFPADNTY